MCLIYHNELTINTFFLVDEKPPAPTDDKNEAAEVCEYYDFAIAFYSCHFLDLMYE